MGINVTTSHILGPPPPPPGINVTTGPPPPPPDINLTTSLILGPPLDNKQIDSTIKITIVLNGISIVCCILVLSVYFGLRRHHKTTLNRISLRLMIAAVIANMLFSVSQIIGTMTGPGSMCTFSMWAYIFFNLLTIWLVTMIAFNLHIVFVYGKSAPLIFESWYFWISLILSCVAFVPLFFGVYGWRPREFTCWYIDSHYPSRDTGFMIAWEFGTYYCWVLIATLYSIIAILNVMRKIHREAGDLAIRTNDDSVVWVSKHDGQKGLSEDERPKTVSEATLIVRRVAWYPVVLIACSLVNMASDIQVSFMSTINFPVYMASHVASGAQGFLICTVFCFDPAMLEIWREKRADLIQRYHTNYDRFDIADRPIPLEDAESRRISLSKEHADVSARPTQWERVMRWVVRRTLVPNEREREDEKKRAMSVSGTTRTTWEVETADYEDDVAGIKGALSNGTSRKEYAAVELAGRSEYRRNQDEEGLLSMQGRRASLSFFKPSSGVPMPVQPLAGFEMLQLKKPMVAANRRISLNGKSANGLRDTRPQGVIPLPTLGPDTMWPNDSEFGVNSIQSDVTSEPQLTADRSTTHINSRTLASSVKEPHLRRRSESSSGDSFDVVSFLKQPARKVGLPAVQAPIRIRTPTEKIAHIPFAEDEDLEL